MISAAVIEALKEIVPADKVLLQEPMKLHTTFRIGGPADCLVYLENEEQLCKIQKYLRLVDVPYTVIGNGSNLLVGDKGFRGTIISTERLAELEVQKKRKHYHRRGRRDALKACEHGGERGTHRPGVRSGNPGNRRRCGHDECGRLRIRDEERTPVGRCDGPGRKCEADEKRGAGVGI